MPTHHYCDSASGSNLNGGTTWGDAWQTLTYALSQILAGPAVLHIRGSFTDNAVVKGYAPGVDSPLAIWGEGDLSGGLTLWNPSTEWANDATWNNTLWANIRSTSWGAGYIIRMNDRCQFINLDLTGAETAGQKFIQCDDYCMIDSCRMSGANPLVNTEAVSMLLYSRVVNSDIGVKDSAAGDVLQLSNASTAFNNVFRNGRYGIIGLADALTIANNSFVQQDTAGVFVSQAAAENWLVAHNYFHESVRGIHGNRIHNAINNVYYNLTTGWITSAIDGVDEGNNEITVSGMDADLTRILPVVQSAGHTQMLRERVGNPWDLSKRIIRANGVT